MLFYEFLQQNNMRKYLRNIQFGFIDEKQEEIERKMKKMQEMMENRF